MGEAAEAAGHVVETNDLDEACAQAIDAGGGDGAATTQHDDCPPPALPPTPLNAAFHIAQRLDGLEFPASTH